MKLTCSRQDEVLNKKAIGFYHIAGGEGAEVKSIIYGIEEEVEVVLFGRQAYRQIIEYDEEGRALSVYSTKTKLWRPQVAGR